MKLLITGGCGFLGSNLASFALSQGIDLIVFDNLSRKGATDNLHWISSLGNFEFVHGDIRNKNDVTRLITKYMPEHHCIQTKNPCIIKHVLICSTF
ncbi:GDP-mannose 4,6-dehydratase [Salmonella enterica]|uniref:GDP-mannose 4,6-dehydratase n=1 Tax=Salmonella enterica TaxID=28901 RepID=UPI0039F0E78D